MSSTIRMNGASVMQAPGREAVLQAKRVSAEAASGQASEFSPFAWKMIVLTLALGALWLAGVAAWVLGGMFRYQDFSRLLAS